MDILQQLSEADSKAAAAKAERERQLQAALDSRKTFVDTTPIATLLDSMYGGQSVKGAQAVQQAAAQQDDVLQELMKEERSGGDALAAAKAAAQQAATQERIALQREGLDLKRAQVAATPAKLTKGQEALDRNFAKTYEEFSASGGYSGAIRNLESLEDAIQTLSQGKGLTGPTVGMFPKGVRDFTNPESAAVQERVEQVVQGSLRQTLGAQFTEKEGMLVIKRAYNPVLSEAENIKRIAAVQKELRGIAEAKAAAAQYFEENGSLVGYKGPSVESLRDQLVAKNRAFEKESSAAAKKTPAQTPAKKNPFR